MSKTRKIIYYLSILFLLISIFCTGQKKPLCKLSQTTDVFGNFWILQKDQKKHKTSISVQAFNNNTWIHFNNKNKLPDGDWRLISSDNNGFVWVAGDSGLLVFDPRKPENNWMKFNHLSMQKLNKVVELKKNTDGNMYVKLETGGYFKVGIDNNGNSLMSKLKKRKFLKRSNWIELSPMPYCSHDVYGAVLNDKIYIPGGAAPHGFPAKMTNFNRMLIYDTTRDHWKISSPMNMNRRYCNVGVLDREIWVIGGYTKMGENEYATNSVEIYNPETDSWSIGPSLDVDCPQPVVAVIRNRLYVVTKNDEPSGSLIYSIAPNEKEWNKETPFLYPVSQSNGCVLNDKLYIIIPQKGLVEYNPTQRTWNTNFPQFPGKIAPRAATVVAYNNSIWIIGGTDTKKENAVWRYSPENNKWSRGKSFSKSICWADGCDVNNTLYVFGGAAFSKIHERYSFWNTIYQLTK